MRNGIREFQPRQPLDRQLSANTLNQILRELESLRITRVVNGTFRKLPGGTEITVAPQRGGSSSQEAHPFQISTGGNAEDGFYCTVRPGTINTLLPTNTFSGETLTQHSYAADQLRYVVLTASATNNQFTSCSISVDSAAPAAQTPALFSAPTTYKVLIGIVRNTSIYQIIYDNIVVSGKQHFVKDRATAAAPGFLPYEIYFVWGL